MATTNNKIRVRKSILEIQQDYENGKPQELENLMTAWAGIKALDPTDLNSFFIIGGYHGEPFRGAGYANNQWWGGWCNHGNVLFPTWHRMYLVRLEQALQSIPGCEDVMLPYWDETDEYSLKYGIPSCLTDDTFTYSDGREIPNPLVSFTFPVNVIDNIASDNNLYTKHAGYTTVRYPYSGLVGNDQARAFSKIHNSQWPTSAEGNKVLNQNVVNWLNQEYVIIQPDNVNNNTTFKAGVYQAYKDCLDAPNYTVFSNTTSSQAYNDLQPEGTKPVMPLEQPHNDIHLAVGGADITNVPGQNFDASPIVGANGDMGENDTAGLDPIFFFHHCNVDRMFWVWQKKTGNTDNLEIIPEYPGTNSVDSQGPTPGVAGNTWLGMDSPLMPFTDAVGNPYQSNHVVNIEKQLNYTYSIGSLDQENWPQGATSETLLLKATETNSNKTLVTSMANKGAVSGSFVIAAYATVNGQKHLVGVKSVLSRHAIQGCSNCQTHLGVKAHFSLNHLAPSVISNPDVDFSAEVISHKTTVSNENFKGFTSEAVTNMPLKVSIR
ncbi:MAG: tyrosinase family protein [Limnohabitans sp.]|nr:tyrosinase family protein [Limnohabitans sp.]